MITIYQHLLDELLPYYPLWSGIVIKKFGIRRNSNACVESWNKIIKQFVFDGKMEQLIPRAITTLKENICQRLLQREYDCRTTRQQNNNLIKKIRESENLYPEDDYKQTAYKNDEKYEDVNVSDLIEIVKEMEVLGISNLISHSSAKKKKNIKRKNVIKKTRMQRKQKVINYGYRM